MIRGYLHWQGQPYFLVWSILSDRLTNINQSFCIQVTFKRYQLLISRFFQILNHAVVGIMINLNCYFKTDEKVGCTSVKQGKIMYIYDTTSRATYQNICPKVTGKPWSVLSPSPDGRRTNILILHSPKKTI